jgi:hypothetical protein
MSSVAMSFIPNQRLARAMVIATWVVELAWMTYAQLVWLPRIVAKKNALQARSDPAGAARRARRMKLVLPLGWILYTGVNLWVLIHYFI